MFSPPWSSSPRFPPAPLSTSQLQLWTLQWRSFSSPVVIFYLSKIFKNPQRWPGLLLEMQPHVEQRGEAGRANKELFLKPSLLESFLLKSSLLKPSLLEPSLLEPPSFFGPLVANPVEGGSSTLSVAGEPLDEGGWRQPVLWGKTGHHQNLYCDGVILYFDFWEAHYLNFERHTLLSSPYF